MSRRCHLSLECKPARCQSCWNIGGNGSALRSSRTHILTLHRFLLVSVLRVCCWDWDIFYSFCFRFHGPILEIRLVCRYQNPTISYANLKQMQSPDALHAKVADHLRKYGRSLPQWSPEETKRKKPTSLGIFMGSFDRSISRHEVRSLSKHDIMILDPYQANLGRSLAALRRHIHHPIDIIGRLDLKAFPSSRVEMHKSDRFLIQLLDQIIDVALKPFKGSDGRNRFNGILLVGWEIFPSMVEK